MSHWVILESARGQEWHESWGRIIRKGFRGGCLCLPIGTVTQSVRLMWRCLLILLDMYYILYLLLHSKKWSASGVTSVIESDHQNGVWGGGCLSLPVLARLSITQKEAGCVNWKWNCVKFVLLQTRLTRHYYRSGLWILPKSLPWCPRLYNYQTHSVAW